MNVDGSLARHGPDGRRGPRVSTDLGSIDRARLCRLLRYYSGTVRTCHVHVGIAIHRRGVARRCARRRVSCTEFSCDKALVLYSNREIVKQLFGTHFVRGVEPGCDKHHSFQVGSFEICSQAKPARPPRGPRRSCRVTTPWQWYTSNIRTRHRRTPERVHET